MTSPARLDATAALRDLVHALVAADADDATLQRTASIVREAVAELEHVPRAIRAVPDFAAGGGPHPLEDGAVDPMADRAVAGSANPTAVHFETRRDGTDAVATALAPYIARVRAAMRGAPRLMADCPDAAD